MTTPPEHDLTTVSLPTAELRVFHGNPRRGNITEIRGSLRRNGYYRPIVVNRGTHTGRPWEVLAGNHTLLAAIEEGRAELQGVVLDVDDDGAARIVAADNRTADLATYDDAALAQLLTDLDDLAGTGYTDDDLAAIVARLEPDPPALTDEDDVPETPTDPVSRVGDVWGLGPHRLLCGDATDRDQVAAVVGDMTPTLIYTDPPYGISIVRGSKVGGGKVVPVTRYRAVAGDESTAVAAASWRLLMTLYPDQLHVWWGGNHYAASAALPDSSCWLVWDKENTRNFADAELAWTNHAGSVRLLRHMWNGMLRASERGKRVHPTQKPVALAVWAFGAVHAEPGGPVFDPFAGSGSTLMAAHQTNRQAVLMELEPAYCDVIARRYQEHTGVVPLRNGVPTDLTEA